MSGAKRRLRPSWTLKLLLRPGPRPALLVREPNPRRQRRSPARLTLPGVYQTWSSSPLSCLSWSSWKARTWTSCSAVAASMRPSTTTIPTFVSWPMPSLQPGPSPHTTGGTNTRSCLAGTLSAARYAPEILPASEENKANAFSQEGLIRKMFFTIDLVLEAQQIWFDTYRPRNKRAHECETDVDCGGCDHCKGGVENVDFHFRECFEHDFKLAKASVKNRKVGWTHFRNRQDVELGVRLGPRILRGPWDEKHEKLIFWLVAGGAIIDHEKWDPQVRASKLPSFKPRSPYPSQCSTSLTIYPWTRSASTSSPATPKSAPRAKSPPTPSSPTVPTISSASPDGQRKKPTLSTSATSPRPARTSGFPNVRCSTCTWEALDT